MEWNFKSILVLTFMPVFVAIFVGILSLFGCHAYGPNPSADVQAKEAIVYSIAVAEEVLSPFGMEL